jgi:hypothetical protein
VAWYHRIHTSGGVSGSIAMVVVFAGCLCCCGLTRDVTSSLYVKYGIKNYLKMRLTALLFDPPTCAPYHHVMMALIKEYEPEDTMAKMEMERALSKM